MDEKRRFNRIVYTTKAKLYLADETWNVELLDLSLKGALVNLIDVFTPDVEQIYHLGFTLEGSDLNLVMSVNVTHQEDNHIGLSCHHMDIDSATHLRRIIELNLGNDDLLMRDLEHLIKAAD